MRDEINKLLSSDVTGYKIYIRTGISQSIISELRLGKRKLDNLSLKNAEKLYEYQKQLEFFESVQLADVKDEDIVDYGNEMYYGFYEMMRNHADNGFMFSYVVIRKVKTEEGQMFEVLDAWADEIRLNQDIDTMEGDILSNEMEEDRYYFHTYLDAQNYVKYKYNPKDLETLITDYLE